MMIINFGTKVLLKYTKQVERDLSRKWSEAETQCAKYILMYYFMAVLWLFYGCLMDD